MVIFQGYVSHNQMVPKHATSLESRTILLMFFLEVVVNNLRFWRKNILMVQVHKKTAESLAFEDDNARSDILCMCIFI